MAVQLLDRVGVGDLTEVYPPDLVDLVIDKAGCREARSRLLPARLVAYFLLGRALFSPDPYREGLRGGGRTVDHGRTRPRRAVDPQPAARDATARRPRLPGRAVVAGPGRHRSRTALARLHAVEAGARAGPARRLLDLHSPARLRP